jgi:hypothetical protein
MATNNKISFGSKRNNILFGYISTHFRLSKHMKRLNFGKVLIEVSFDACFTEILMLRIP